MRIWEVSSQLVDEEYTQHDIDCQQCGNMKGSWVVHYPVSLLDSIQGGVNKLGNYANLCNINLRKAFDHVNYTISIEKLIQLFIYIHGRGSWKSVNPHGVNPSAASDSKLPADRRNTQTPGITSLQFVSTDQTELAARYEI